LEAARMHATIYDISRRAGEIGVMRAIQTSIESTKVREYGTFAQDAPAGVHYVYKHRYPAQPRASKE
jgi:hypothetical protein